MWKNRSKQTDSAPEPEPTSSYWAAIQFTTTLIDARSARFKRLMIGFVSVGLVSLLLALILGSGLPLLGLLFLPPLVGDFLCADTLLVNQWREHIMTLWAREHIDLPLMVETIRVVPGMPDKTLEGLLGSLPKMDSPDLSVPATLRQALLLTQQALDHLQVQRVLLTTALYSIGLMSLVVALVAGSGLPLLGLVFIPFIWVCARWLIGRRLYRSRKDIDRLFVGESMDADGYVRLATTLDWRSVPPKWKNKWLASSANRPEERLGTA
jgi:hypothetical protein